MSSLVALLLALSFSVISILPLDPDCAPGGNFDLSKWKLSLPIGTSSKPDTPLQIPGDQLEGCDGYEDPGHDYFFTESGDGALVMKVQGDPSNSKCITFSGSKHCRTELKETTPSTWKPSASQNRLKMTLLATAASGTICIGQVGNDDYGGPLAEVYYQSNGKIVVGVETTPDLGNQHNYTVGTVPRGTKFSYELRYEGGRLGIAINGGSLQNLGLFYETENCHFNAGNYNQGTAPSDVHVFALTTTHAA